MKTSTIFVNALLRIIERATHTDQGLFIRILRIVVGLTLVSAFALECFRTISRIPVSILEQQFILNGSKALSLLSRLVNSHKPNTQYFVLACLTELDAVFWAGTTEGIPAVFDEEQVRTIMGFLDSSDSTIRVKVRVSLWGSQGLSPCQTLQMLSRVDSEILLVHLTQLISGFHASMPHDEDRFAERVLEVSAVYEQTGGPYAMRLREVCTQMTRENKSKGKHKATDSGVQLVSENVVEQVLLHLRSSTSNPTAFEFLINILPRSRQFPWGIHRCRYPYPSF